MTIYRRICARMERHIYAPLRVGMERHIYAPLRAGIATSKTRLGRRAYIKGVDSIPTLRQRCPDFERLRDAVRRAGTDSLHDFANDYTHEGGLYLQQNPDEFAALCLYLQAHRPYGNYMEIGSASGGACLLLWQEVGFANVLSLDDGRHPRAMAQATNFAQIPQLKQFIGDSHAPAAKRFLQEQLKGSLDVAFIDGDHSYEGVCQDIELALAFSRPGTLMILHDTIACEGVERAWLQSAQEKIIKPLAEYIGEDRPLGIGIGSVL